MTALGAGEKRLTFLVLGGAPHPPGPPRSAGVNPAPLRARCIWLSGGFLDSARDRALEADALVDLEARRGDHELRAVAPAQRQRAVARLDRLDLAPAQAQRPAERALGAAPSRSRRCARPAAAPRAPRAPWRRRQPQSGARAGERRGPLRRGRARRRAPPGACAQGCWTRTPSFAQVKLGGPRATRMRTTASARSRRRTALRELKKPCLA